ncbi:UbiA family prenyltransferase [Hymenobacter sp. BT491]|uniref:UbiA family prenyltransferase n=1 Tax=Hymenobacter sp. BT491 TaxID=2766779 RepID=UPI001653445E|nr:UbiA family prenyltransferase [Hymenobacter sp. BT491]MBC6991453.1 UbiA family prenyltransferase [Hymenobacter sp. BT491]
MHLSSDQPSARSAYASVRSCTDAVLYSSGLVAAAAMALTWATFLFWHVHIPLHLAAMIFSATLFLYNLDSVLPYKYTEQQVLSTRKLWMLHHRRQLLLLALLSLGVAGVLFLRDGWTHLTGFLGHLAAISLFYSLPVVKRQGQWRGLRDVPLLKAFLIAYVWSAVTVWVPALYLSKPVGSAVVMLLFARRFFFILAIAVVFDIRDYTKDRLGGTRTFPVLLGVKWAKLLALAALVLAAVFVPEGLSAVHIVVLTLPLLLTAILVWFAEESRPDYYFSILADGIMVIQFIAVYLTF